MSTRDKGVEPSTKDPKRGGERGMFGHSTVDGPGTKRPIKGKKFSDKAREKGKGAMAYASEVLSKGTSDPSTKAQSKLMVTMMQLRHKGKRYNYT